MTQSVLFDTSVLVAAIVQDHPQFNNATPWIQSVQQGKLKGWIASHALAELYTVLTRLPSPYTVTPSLADRIIHQAVESLFSLVDLSTRDYFRAVRRVSERSLKGHLIYDALHVQAALKKEIPVLLTFNQKDFTRLIDNNEMELKDPMKTADTV